MKAHLQLIPFAERHHGVVTRAAAAEVGMSKTAWYRALATGALEAMFPNVARFPGTKVNRLQLVMAAVLASGSEAMASHRSAIWLWGVPRSDDDPIDVLFPSRTSGLRLPGVVRHRPRDLLDLRPLGRHGIPTTNILRSLADLGAVDPSGLPGAVGHVITTGLAAAGALEKAVRTHSRRGRPGVPALREALADWMIDGKPADSVLEPAMRDLLKRYRLPPARFHEIVCGFEVDFRIIDTPVVLECDGWDSHGRTREQFERDAERDEILIANGYLPVHFTYNGITKRPRNVAERIRGALRNWGHVSPQGDPANRVS